MFNEELNIPSEIKNRIFAIWYCSAVDTVKNCQQESLKLSGQCQLRKLENTAYSLELFGNLVESIKIQLRLIDTPNQISLRHFRNTLVHGRLHSIHNPQIIHPIFDHQTDQVVDKHIDKSEYWNLINSIWKENIDDSIEPIREQFLDSSSIYFRNVRTLCSPGFLERFTELAYLDLTGV